MARDYSKIASTFWTGDTGRALRSDRDAQVVALYLVSGPTANMIGLYHLPLALIADHTGIKLGGASKGLRRVCEVGFARWDAHLEHIFVPEMAAYQIGEKLDPRDKRVKGVISMWQMYRKSPLYLEFHSRYAKSFHLPEPSPLQAPSKPGAGAGTGTGAGELAATSGKRFAVPTVEQVSEYCTERNNHLNPQKFVDYYASKGWVIGTSPMKDWKAAVRTWEQNESKHRNNGSKLSLDFNEAADEFMERTEPR